MHDLFGEAATKRVEAKRAEDLQATAKFPAGSKSHVKRKDMFWSTFRILDIRISR